MTDFVVYHNQDTQHGPPRSPGNGDFSIFTEKPHLDRLLGHRVWVVSGRGSPRNWSIHYWFHPSSVEPGGVRGDVGASAPSVDGVGLDGFDWFKRLYIDRKLFSFGLQSLTSPEGLLLVNEFANLAKDWTKRGSPGSPPAGPRRREGAVAGPRAVRRSMQTLPMNIKRQWFAAIVAGTKLIEYRRMSPFWKRRIEPLTVPFKLRLMNGMTHPIPEAVVVVTRVTRHPEAREYRLHLGRVLQVRRWDRRRLKPRA